MTFLIKSLISIVFFMTSCSAIDLGYVRLYQEALADKSIQVDQNFIDSVDYSFMHVKQGDAEAIFILSDSSENVNTWIGSNYEKIVTYKGLIVMTSGLEQDFKFVRSNLKHIKENHLINDFESIISLTNPDLSYWDAQFNLVNIENNRIGFKNCSRTISYSRKLKELSRVSYDIYCLDENDTVISAQQKINPLSTKLEISFYY